MSRNVTKSGRRAASGAKRSTCGPNSPQHTAPGGLDRGGESRHGLRALQQVAFVDLEQNGGRSHAGDLDPVGEEHRQPGLLQRLARYVDGEALRVGGARELPEEVPQDPAVELRHHLVVLEHRQELSGRM